MDRNRHMASRTTSPSTTSSPDGAYFAEALRRVVAREVGPRRPIAAHTPRPRPADGATEARRVLALAADNLDAMPALVHPYTGHRVAHCISAGFRDNAVRNALQIILARVHRPAARQAIQDAVAAMLPPLSGTTSQYADALRAEAVA
jgi:hypothetical protein